jgi:hypothetical protein
LGQVRWSAGALKAQHDSQPDTTRLTQLRKNSNHANANSKKQAFH